MMGTIAKSNVNARYTPYFRFELTRWQLNIAVAVLLTLVFNQPLVHSLSQLGGPALLLPLLALLFLLNILLCQVFSIGIVQKTWLLALLLLSASAQYFMLQYGLVIDKGMLVNALETDHNEVSGLLNPTMLPYFVAYFLLPASFILLVRLPSLSRQNAVRQYAATTLSGVMLIAILVLTQYQNFAALFREHRELKHQAIPLAVFSAANSVLRDKITPQITVPFQHFAEDARLAVEMNAKPQLVIMVLGETVRADHLGINGYQRNTTPHLAQQEIINLGAIDACGTATAVSVPCMFSYLNQVNYDERLAKNSDNLLDVLQRAGVKVLWRDNNSGCKSMCDRVQQDSSFTEFTSSKCSSGTCPDSALLNGLRQKILAEKSSGAPIFIVLHQQGNHGPEYFKRSKPSQKHFLPECESNLLNQCAAQDIVNAYDNALVATDELLDETIQLLKTLSNDFDTSMLYVSDHGESLGENGIYLHGLPYWMAPEAQTKVPMIMWMSEQTMQHSALNSACIRQNASHIASHDMLFDSVLSWLHLESEAIRPEQDIFHGCIELAQKSGNNKTPA